MLNFNQSTVANMKVEFNQALVPKIRISEKALASMYVYVDECPKEIGWLCTAVYNDELNSYDILEAFLFKQQVSAVTTEITSEGLTEFAEELLQRPDGIEIWNNLKAWGHSHVNMGTSPSGQDDIQMEEFSENGSDWFLRIIANKKGDMRVDLYNFKIGITYLNMAWEPIKSDFQTDIERQIHELQEQIANQKAGSIDDVKLLISAQIKEKVSNIPYAHVVKPGGVYNSNHGTYWSKDKALTTMNDYDDYFDQWGTSGDGRYAGIKTLEDVLDYITIEDAIDLEGITNTVVFEEELGELGYSNYFTYAEMLVMMGHIPAIISKYKGA